MNKNNDFLAWEAIGANLDNGGSRIGSFKYFIIQSRQ